MLALDGFVAGNGGGAVSRPRPIKEMPLLPIAERNQDSRIQAALDLAERVIYPTAVRYRRSSSNAEKLLAHAVLDLHAQLKAVER